MRACLREHSDDEGAARDDGPQRGGEDDEAADWQLDGVRAELSLRERSKDNGADAHAVAEGEDERGEEARLDEGVVDHALLRAHRAAGGRG